MKIIVLSLFLVSFPVCNSPGGKIMAESKWNELTPDEKHVIVDRGTEKPFTGAYCEQFAAGLYQCRRCNAPLYRSDDKFPSHCGWPGFDDEFSGAVKRVPDADGLRTEIVCAACGAHLGHVFQGENYTRKNLRHCVNSISLRWVPATSPDYGRILLAGGCFWGVEYYLQQLPGVLHTAVGYTGGHQDYPTYDEVCQHSTGHAETVEVIFDPAVISFEQLVRRFLEIHDPTQLNRQGPDIGDQYRSAIFYYNDFQRRTAEKLLDELRRNGYHVVSKVVPAPRFWPAEEYHRNYYRRHGQQTSCHIPVARFAPPK